MSGARRRRLTAADSTLLAHLDEQDAVREDGRAVELLLSARGAAAMQASSVLDSARVKKMLRQLTVAERQRALDGLALLGRAARKAQGAGK